MSETELEQKITDDFCFHMALNCLTNNEKRLKYLAMLKEDNELRERTLTVLNERLVTSNMTQDVIRGCIRFISRLKE